MGGKNDERVPPRTTGSFSDRRKGTKSPPKNPPPWAACPGCARSALRATADLRPKSRLRRLASETRSADRSRGRSAPRPRLESATRTRPCGPDFLSRVPFGDKIFPRVPPPGKLAAPSVPACWERPQPELSLQLVYPWGAAVVCGLWQGTSGDSKGPGGGSFGALLSSISWANKKWTRPPGRDPAISAAEGGSP